VLAAHAAGGVAVSASVSGASSLSLGRFRPDLFLLQNLPSLLVSRVLDVCALRPAPALGLMFLYSHSPANVCWTCALRPEVPTSGFPPSVPPVLTVGHQGRPRILPS
jgi:hypothetical protein